MRKLIITIIPCGIRLRPSPEVFRGYPGQFAKSPLITRKLLLRLSACNHNLSLFFKCISSEDALHVGYRLYHIHRRGDIEVLKNSDS